MVWLFLLIWRPPIFEPLWSGWALLILLLAMITLMVVVRLQLKMIDLLAGQVAELHEQNLKRDRLGLRN